MRISNSVYMLEIQGDNGFYYPVLLHDDNNLIIVDAGYPMHSELLEQTITGAGFKMKDIDKIIFTHQDIDHIGCAKEIIQAADKIEVLAHAEEAPYIDGTLTPIKLAEMDKKNTAYQQLKEAFDARRIKIDKTLLGGDILPYCGGIEILHTPGHTPGHICLYLKKDKVLITGDALNINNGKLIGANPVYTQDMELANKSVQKLYDYEISTVLTYHGGRYDDEFNINLN